MRVPYVNFPQQFAEGREETMAAVEKVLSTRQFYPRRPGDRF